MQMSAAPMTEVNNPLQIVWLELDEPKRDEVLVRLAATGSGASNAHTPSGRIPSPLPCVLGHDSGGVVTETPTTAGRP